MLVHPSGEVEVARAKRWIATDADRGRVERVTTQGAKAFTPFGHVKPAPLEALAAHLRRGAVLDLSPARLIPLAEPQAKGLLVMACLTDEAAVAGTSQTGTLSPFTQSLLNEIQRHGLNRSAFELLQATGHTLRQLGLRQTPLIKEPLQPEHLGLRAFLTFQPVLSAFPSQGPGREQDDDLTRSIAEAVRTALTNFQEGRSMQATMPGQQTFFTEPYGAGAYSPLGFGAPGFQPGFQGWPGQHAWWQGGFGQRAQFEEIAQLVGAIVPAVLANLQSRSYQQQPYLSGYQGLQPQDVAQIVNTVTPIVASLIQSRGYQGHFGQFLPRAA